jgi:hypothetical protein
MNKLQIRQVKLIEEYSKNLLANEFQSHHGSHHIVKTMNGYSVYKHGDRKFKLDLDIHKKITTVSFNKDL